MKSLNPCLHIYFMTQKPIDKGLINVLTSEDETIMGQALFTILNIIFKACVHKDGVKVQSP